MGTDEVPSPTEPDIVETLSGLLATCAEAAERHEWRQLREAIRNGDFASILQQCSVAAHSREEDEQLFDDVHTGLVVLRERSLHDGLDMDVLLQYRDVRPAPSPR